MASSSSSTKRAARLAQKGKGKKVRFQGGTVFPAAVAAVLILGLALVVYARQTLPAADTSRPAVTDHWHAAYGFYLCDTWYQLDGNLEERDSRGQFTNVNYLRTGIHSHDDGVIHWHPINSQGVGRNAKLGVFLDTYEVELENDKITFPDTNILGGQQVWEEGETQCDGEDAEVSVKAWGNFTDTDGGTRFIADMDDIRLENDGMVFAIYFTEPDAPQVMPPWAQQLPQLGQIDSGNVLPQDLLEGESVPVGGSVPTGSVAPAGTLVPNDVDADTVTDTETDDGSSDEVTTDDTGSTDSSDG